MKWKIVALMLFALLMLSACASSKPVPASNSDPEPAPPAESEKTTQQADAAEVNVTEVDATEADVVEVESETQQVVTVYKSPTCGCCGAWIEHLEEDGFVVEANDTNDLATIKAENQVPPQLQSCHTAIIDGYVIEGHVPAEDINRLLAERPNVVGLAVPGMPAGSPGMEIDGHPGQPFDVIAFDQSGNVEIFASHNETE